MDASEFIPGVTRLGLRVSEDILGYMVFVHLIRRDICDYCRIFNQKRNKRFVDLS